MTDHQSTGHGPAKRPRPAVSPGELAALDQARAAFAEYRARELRLPFEPPTDGPGRDAYLREARALVALLVALVHNLAVRVATGCSPAFRVQAHDWTAPVLDLIAAWATDLDAVEGGAR